jgi:hypothetical protein
VRIYPAAGDQRLQLMTVRAITPPLPHSAMPDADWADCFEIFVPGERLSAEAVARRAFERMPSWVDRLMWLRNLLVRPFGLKRDRSAIPDGTPMVGFFPVTSASERELVLGFDDRHLDFRIVVLADQTADGGTRARLMTLIRRHNWLGRSYLAAIMPFHKLIVHRALSRIGLRN